MASDQPSLYPRPMSSTNGEWAASATSPANPRSNQETLPPDYELLLQVSVRLTELEKPSPAAGVPIAPALSQPVTDSLRIIQGPLPPSSPEKTNECIFYHAFMSVASVNIPLLPTCIASRPESSTFRLNIPNRIFVIQVLNANAELDDSFESLLRWFCQWRSNDGTTTSSMPSGTTPSPPTSTLHPSTPAQSPPPAKSSDRFEMAGDKGVELVERFGAALNNRINRALEQRRDAVREENKKELKLGGKVTSSLLSTTRKVVGAGATVASKLTERISSSVGARMADNSATRSMSNAPVGSAKRTLYDNLMSGLLVCGRVYVAADKHGKIILEDIGTRAEEITHRKYGAEAAAASRNVSGIALDTYRISRFPQKLGATAIVRGAVKSRMPPQPDTRPSFAANGQATNNDQGGNSDTTEMYGWNDVSEDHVPTGSHSYPSRI